MSPARSKSTEGGITYAEWSYAKDNKLGMAQIDNGAGPVELTGETVGKAVAAAKQVGTGNDLSLKLDYTTKEAGAYPIVLVTYEIVCSKDKDAGQGRAAQGLPQALRLAPSTQKALEDHRLRAAAGRGGQTKVDDRHRRPLLTPGPAELTAGRTTSSAAPGVPRTEGRPRVPSDRRSAADELPGPTAAPRGRPRLHRPARRPALRRRGHGRRPPRHRASSPWSRSFLLSRRPGAGRRPRQLPDLRRVAVAGDNPRFGIADLLWTTVASSIIAMLIAVPLGVGVALFITQYAPPLAARARGVTWSTCWPPCPRSSTASGALTSSARTSSRVQSALQHGPRLVPVVRRRPASAAPARSSSSAIVLVDHGAADRHGPLARGVRPDARPPTRRARWPSAPPGGR